VQSYPTRTPTLGCRYLGEGILNNENMSHRFQAGNVVTMDGGSPAPHPKTEAGNASWFARFPLDGSFLPPRSGSYQRTSSASTECKRCPKIRRPPLSCATRSDSYLDPPAHSLVYLTLAMEIVIRWHIDAPFLVDSTLIRNKFALIFLLDSALYLLTLRYTSCFNL
jgi:hypothetical protein